jgi:hypothetical protein
MREAHDEGTGLGEAVQYPSGDQWVRRSLCFPQHEYTQHDEARHEYTQDLGRVPRKDDTAEVQTQQRQDRHAHDRRTSKPVHLPALPDGRELRVCGAEERRKNDEGDKAAREVDPENPAPIQILSEHASQERANTS